MYNQSQEGARVIIMRKILIIGAKSLLGQELVRVFKSDSDYKVIGWEQKDLNITQEKEVHKKIGVIKPEIILNAVSYTALDECEREKREYELAKKINGLAPGYLAAAAKKNKSTFVHYSDDYVFNGQPDIPEPTGCTHVCATCALHEGFQPQIGFDEEARPEPISKYGETKLMGEEAVKKNLKKNYYIIRFGKLFGQVDGLEETERDFLKTALENGQKGKEQKIVDEEISNFTYALDLARKTKEIIDAKKPAGIYHITNSGSATEYEVVTEAYKQAGIKTKIIPVTREDCPVAASRPFYSVLLNTKLNPLRSWQEALKDYLKTIGY